MYILALAQTHINTGDILFQFFMFVFFLAIPLAIIVSVLVLRRRTNRLKQIEEKLDQLLSEKKN